MAAIYDFSSTDFGIIEITTTLYPVVIAELMEINCAPIDDTWWLELITETGTGSFIGPYSAQLRPIRFTAPEQGPESGTGSFVGPYSAIKYTIRFDAPEQGPENGTASFIGPISAELNYAKIEADSPDEKLEITCSIEPDSTMTL